MKYHFITIEGNIGAGKTTLATMLSERLNAKLILEAFADNPFLPKFYENREQFAFPLELFFMAERYKQLKDLLHAQDLFHEHIVSDYLFVKSLLFAKVNLPEAEFNLYQRLFNIINPQLVQPDLLIYLHAPLSKLKENIKKRNRSYEQSIASEYLMEIEETYIQYLKQHNHRTLFINTENVNFVDDKSQLNAIIALLDRDFSPGVHYISID